MNSDRIAWHPANIPALGLSVGPVADACHAVSEVHTQVALERLNAGVFKRIQLISQHECDFDRRLVIFLLGPTQTRPRLLFALFPAADNRVADLALVKA